MKFKKITHPCLGQDIVLHHQSALKCSIGGYIVPFSGIP
jgi:hypothetical protein